MYRATGVDGVFVNNLLAASIAEPNWKPCIVDDDHG